MTATRNRVRSGAQSEKARVSIGRAAPDSVSDREPSAPAPTLRERTLGRAEVRQVFSVPSAGRIAGCFIVDGKITRGGKARVVRDHVVVHDGKIDTLRRFKDDAREVAAGYECGLSLENFQDIKEGDIVEAFEMREIPRA